MIDELFSDIEAQLLTEKSAAVFNEFLDFIDETLGIDLKKIEPISDEQQHLIAERLAARASHDWTKSDELRNELDGQGIGVRDTPQGPIWFRL
jgi:cysteinyl-tRNA synthetase